LFRSCNTSIVSQNWDFGDGDFGTGANPSHNYLINAELDISLIVTDQLGCKDTISKTRNLTVHQRPSPRFVADTTYGCKPFTVQFTDLSIPRDSAFLTDWLWNFGDGQTSTDQDPLHVYANRGAYTVILTVTNSHGCDSTWVINNYITPTFPYPSYSFPSPVCHYDSVHFINSSTGGGLAYQWDFGDLSPIYTTTSPYHDFDPDTTMWYYLSLLATDTNGCDSTLIDSIRISRPIAYFYADSVESECPPFGGQFRDSSTADVISWSWNFGDIMSGTANTSANADPYHIYYSAGKYDVQLVIINNDGCRDTLREMDFIYVHGPSGTFDFNPKVGCAPLTVTFVATTQNAAEYQWVFDDGNAITTSADTITYTYSDGKNYIPVLVMTDSLDGPLDSILCSVALIPDTNLIVISGGAMFFADTNLLCSPDSIHFTDTSFASSNSYINAWSWQFGDMLTDVVPDPAHFYAAPGLFDVTLTVTIDSCVYSYTFDDYIRVSGLTGDFSFAPTYSCEPPLNVNFTSTATEADHYAWSFGDASSGSGQNISHIYQAGHFDPLLVIQDTITYNGDTVVCYDSIGSPITIDVLDGYVDFAVDTTYSCYPSTFFFADSSLYNDTIDAWNWHFGDGDSSMIQDPSHFYANTGYFTVTLTVTIDSCIYDSTRINYVQVYDPPDILFSLSDTANCYPLIVFFDIIDSTVTDSVISWFWSFGDGFGDTIMEPTHIYDTTNTYNIVVTATLWNQCLYAYSQTRDLIVFPLPVADFISNHDIYLTRRVVKFTNQSQPADSIVGYYWEFGDGENDNVVNPEHEYNYVGEYDVMLVVLTGDGCVDTVYKTVDVIPREDIPNAFTPNGDGINDVFLDGFQLTILNRWGQVLYEGTDGWDGTYNGQAVSKGTYFFIVLLDEVQDAFQKIHGSVTIVDN
ncbi:MAG: PKD domain-containing protein, partial [Bacteroidetes bacterium]|nr:PKD domain-containing protein [Bacteroidota bacterium]